MPLNGTFSNPMSPSKSSYIVEWYDVLSFLIAFIGIVGNTFVIYLVKTRSSLKETSNTFVLSLAVADLLVSVIIQPSKFACDVQPACNVQLQRIFSELFIYWSVYNLCGLTIERYISIVFPMKRSTFMSKTRITVCIILCWLIPLVNFGLHFPWFYSSSNETRMFWLKTFTAIETCTMVGIPAIILVVLYARIFFVAQKHRRITAHQIGIVNYNKDLKNAVIRKNDSNPEVNNEIAVVAGCSEEKETHEKLQEKRVFGKMSLNETRCLTDETSVDLEVKEVCECQKNRHKEQKWKDPEFFSAASTDNKAEYHNNGLVISVDETSLTIERNGKHENEAKMSNRKKLETTGKTSAGFWRGLSCYPVLYNTHKSTKSSKQSIKKRLEQLLTPKQRRSGVSVIGCVIGIFLICWGVALYSSFCYYFARCPVSKTTQRVSWILLLLNSAVNPIVYALLKLDMRAEFLRLLRSWVNRLASLKGNIKIKPIAPNS